MGRFLLDMINHKATGKTDGLQLRTAMMALAASHQISPTKMQPNKLLLRTAKREAAHTAQ